MTDHREYRVTQGKPDGPVLYFSDDLAEPAADGDLSYSDALRALAATTNVYDELGDFELEDLFDAGVITSARDITDEYATFLTREGFTKVVAAVKRAEAEHAK